MSTEMEVTLNTEIVPATQKASELVVKNQDDRSYAVTFGKSLRELKERIEDKLHPNANKRLAYESYTSALDTEKALFSPIDEAIKVVTQKIKAYDTAKALKAQQIALKAEAERQEKERIEREKLEAKAQKAESQGKIEKAEALREQAETVVIAPKFTPPTNGKKLIWKAEVVNMVELCKSIVAGKIPYNVVDIRQSALNDFAKSYDGKTKIEGLLFRQETYGRI